MLRVAGGFLALAALMGVAGCRLETAVTVAVRPDGSGDLRLEAVADDELVARATAFAGADPVTEFITDDLEAAGWVVTRDARAHRLVLDHNFRSPQELSALITSVDPGGSTPVLRDFELSRGHSLFEDRYALTGAVDLKQGGSAEPLAVALQGMDMGLLSDVAGGDLTGAFGMTVTAVLPGETQQTNAAFSGAGRYWWSVQAGSAIVLQADTRRRNVLTLVTAAGVVVLVLLVLTISATVAVGARRAHRRGS